MLVGVGGAIPALRIGKYGLLVRILRIIILRHTRRISMRVRSCEKEVADVRYWLLVILVAWAVRLGSPFNSRTWREQVTDGMNKRG